MNSPLHPLHFLVELVFSFIKNFPWKFFSLLYFLLEFCIYYWSVASHNKKASMTGKADREERTVAGTSSVTWHEIQYFPHCYTGVTLAHWTDLCISWNRHILVAHFRQAGRTGCILQQYIQQGISSKTQLLEAEEELLEKKWEWKEYSCWGSIFRHPKGLPANFHVFLAKTRPQWG